MKALILMKRKTVQKINLKSGGYEGFGSDSIRNIEIYKNKNKRIRVKANLGQNYQKCKRRIVKNHY